METSRIDEVGAQLERHGDRLGPVGRLADDLEVGLGGEDPAHAVADDGVVVGDEDASPSAAWSRAGISRRTRVPRVGPLPTHSRPWTSSARSRIPVMPRASDPA